MSDKYYNQADAVRALYKAERKEIDYLKEQLVSKCNQLEVAIESLKSICDIGGSKKIFEIPRHIQMWEEANKALEQITAEQKDK